MFIQQWGNPRNPTALLIHGLSSSSSAWRYLAPQLVADGYYVLAPDLLGHGQSPRSDEYSVERFAEAIKNEIRDSPVDLIIGHSLGGLIATFLKDDLYPRKMVLLDPVLKLPPTKLLVGTTQKIFKETVTDRLGLLQKSRKSWPAEAHEYEKVNYANWDNHTVRALESRPVLVESVLGSGNGTDIMIIRTKNSYITPANIEKRYASKVAFHYVLGGHNINIEKPEEVHDLIQNFVGVHKKPRGLRKFLNSLNQWRSAVPHIT